MASGSIQIRQMYLCIFIGPLSELSSIQVDTDILCQVAAVPWVNLKNVANESLLNVLSALAQRAAQVSYDVFPILLSENLVEESSWLLVVVIWMLVWVSSNAAGYSLLRKGK